MNDLGPRALTETPATVPAPSEVSALILADGEDSEIGRSTALLECAGKTLLERAVEQVGMFAGEILIGLHQDLDRVPTTLRDRSVGLLAAGETLNATIEMLLQRATRPLVLLHEISRPLAPPALFSEVLKTAHVFGAAAPSMLVGRRDALALHDGSGFLGAMLPTDQVVRVQTPQAYRWTWLADAFRRAKGRKLPHASSLPPLLLDAGYRVRLVPGSPENFRIMFPADWEAMRVKLLTGRWPA